MTTRRVRPVSFRPASSATCGRSWWGGADASLPHLSGAGYVAAMGGRRLTLPLGVAILLAVAGLAAHLLPPAHLMRTRRRQRFTVTRSAP